ncbi:MFS transporter [Pseudoglutamicibacter cumminsii]|uniref:MFS transporter n=1 Tax=Pseudoglutamicibacter cumminsii TaxID=156979 RepID=UPI00195E0E67|nr:MFS transporter [Pseudoglutamicibacter cumminsii]MBM7795696.1 DHA2 family multidrug resistance protein-like MFS transporter [Pseudoglutamicibacter cumminsii]
MSPQYGKYEQLIPSARRRWAALALLMIVVLLVSVDNSVMVLALPEIAVALYANATEQLWVLDIYPLVLAGLLVPMGNLGDRIGRRRIMIIGAVGFAVVSGIAAFSVSPTMLIVFRALQAVFGAALMPATLSLIRNIFPDPRERTTAVAIWAATFSAGAALGPIIGGVLLNFFWWGSVLLMAVPILVPFLAGAPFLLPESKDPNPGPLDVLSILLAMATLLPLTYGIKTLPQEPWVGVGAIAFALVAGFVFVRRQLGADIPFLDVRLLSRKAFALPLTINLLAMFSLVGFLYYLSQHLQLIEGRSPAEAALFMLPGMAMTVVAGLAVVPVARWTGPVPAMVAGVLCSALAYGILAVFVGSGDWVPMVAFLLIGAGAGMAETISNDFVLSAVPSEKAGAASAMSETAYEFGTVMGAAVLGGLLNALYTAKLVPPAGLSEAQGAQVASSLASAHDVAAGLPHERAAELLQAASHAFDAGVTVTATVAGVLALAVSIAVYFGLRTPRDAK